ncbi:MAG: hypothetical protein HY675_17260 [Chloroflexi bacterium]|nr:hypothetical protein [Chloroflexota bacterium]
MVSCLYQGCRVVQDLNSKREELVEGTLSFLDQGPASSGRGPSGPQQGAG